MPKNKRPKKEDTSDSDSGPEDRGPAPKAPAKTSAEGDDPSWDLGKNRFVKLTEFKGKWYVNIREFYNAPDGSLKPGKKGIMLTMEQWHKFKNIVPELEDAIKKHV